MPAFATLPRRSRWPRLLGLASLFAAVGCAAYLLFGGIYSSTTEAASDTEGGVVTVTTTQGWQGFAIVGWASFIVLLGIVTALAAWRGRSGPVSVSAFLLLILTVLGVASIGLFVAPVALLFAFTASTLSVSRRRVRAANSSA